MVDFFRKLPCRNQMFAVCQSRHGEIIIKENVLILLTSRPFLMSQHR